MKTALPPLLVGIISSLVLVGTAFAEMRTWTDTKGRTLEGSLVRLDGDEAVIKLKVGSEVRVKRSLLSAKDNQYLAEYGGASSAVVACPATAAASARAA